MDQGLIHPLTVLKDSAQSFGSYAPENSDGRFVGPLTATEALNLSRVEICAASGELPNADCPQCAHTWVIPANRRSASARCTASW